MKEYFLTIACAGIAAAVGGFLFDGKQNENIARYIRFAFALCILCVTVFPLLRFLRSARFEAVSLPEFSEAEFADLQKRYDEYVIERARVSLCETLSERILEKTGIMPQSVDIQFITSENDEKIEVAIQSVRIAIEPPSEELAKAVKEWTGVYPEIVPPETGREE